MKRSNNSFSRLFWLFIFGSLLYPLRLLAFNSNQPFDISADVLEYVDETQEMTATGHVVVVQSSSTLSADLVRYDRLHRRLIARGNVILRELDKVAIGDQMDYDLDAQKGIVLGGKAAASSWFFQGGSWEKNEDYYIGRNASFTNCDLIDPHYHIRSSRVHLIPDHTFWAWNNVFYLDDKPVFYTPFMYKNLEDQRLVFQAQPGSDSQNGAFAKTTTTMRLTPHAYDKFYWDYYSEAGNGFGNELDFQNPGRYKGSLFGYYIDPHPSVLLAGQPTGPQYNFRSYLWQQVAPTVQLQANANLRQNVAFNNLYFSQDPNQSQNDILSSVALTHQTKTFNEHLVVQREDAPDPTDTGPFAVTHMQSASLPNYDFTLFQRPLWSPKAVTPAAPQIMGPFLPGTTTSQPVVMGKPSKIGPILFNVTGAFQNQFLRTDNLVHSGAQTVVNLSEAFPFARDWSYTTTISPQLNWQDKDAPVATSTGLISGITSAISTDSLKGLTGRTSFGNNLRWRPMSALTIDATHSLTERMKPNDFGFARDDTDHGVETNALTLATNMRPSSKLLLRMSSGFDFRRLDDESLDDYEQRKWMSWNSDVTYTPNRRWEYYASELISHYPMRTAAWQLSATYHGLQRTQLISSVIYNRNTPGIMSVNQTIGYYFGPSWRVDTTISALMPSTSLGAVRSSNLIGSNLVVERDMHCWNVQFIYRDQPPFSRSYSVLFNLKMGEGPTKKIADNDLESQFYPWRANGPDPAIR